MKFQFAVGIFVAVCSSAGIMRPVYADPPPAGKFASSNEPKEEFLFAADFDGDGSPDRVLIKPSCRKLKSQGIDCLVVQLTSLAGADQVVISSGPGMTNEKLHMAVGPPGNYAVLAGTKKEELVTRANVLLMPIPRMNLTMLKVWRPNGPCLGGGGCFYGFTLVERPDSDPKPKRTSGHG
jgi:hypothetical protein